MCITDFEQPFELKCGACSTLPIDAVNKHPGTCATLVSNYLCRCFAASTFEYGVGKCTTLTNFEIL